VRHRCHALAMILPVGERRATVKVLVPVVPGPPSLPERLARALEEMGGKLVDDFALLGTYDFLFIAEAPNEEVMYRAALRATAHGIITLHTMAAIPFEDFGRIVREMER